MPSADEVLPFLRRIDESRQYSNSGPLVQELETRLNGACVASATIGLELAAKVLYPKGSKVRIPAFTFPATATALLRAGLEPVLDDVDRDTWALTDPGKDSLPVSPFGAAIKHDAPLVDAASAWGNGQAGNCVYSLHATKLLGAGEGGAVCGSWSLTERIRKLANFGFVDGLMTVDGGTNAKMSEYHAAVALAQLRRFPTVTARLQAIEARYRRNLGYVVEMQNRPVGNYAIFPILVHDRERVKRELAAAGIATRSWYCPTLEKHPLCANLRLYSPLSISRMLSETVLCLPFHSFMTDEDVDGVSDRVRTAVSERRQLRARA